MKLLPFLFLFLCFSLNLAGQSFSKEDIKKYKIKKIFSSENNEIQEYDTSGCLVTISTKSDNRAPFLTNEFKYDPRLLKLIEERKYQSYSPNRVEIIQYFYNEKGLQVKIEDTIICPTCEIPKRITEDEYNDSNLVEVEKYQDGDYRTLKKYHYNKKGLLEKIEASTGKEIDYFDCYFYDDSKNLIRDSVFNLTSRRSLRNYYKYNAEGKLSEIRNVDNKGLYWQISYVYNEEGLPSKTISKQRGDEHNKYYTSITYFSYEKY